MTISPGNIDNLLNATLPSGEYGGVGVQSYTTSGTGPDLTLSSITITTTGTPGPGALDTSTFEIDTVDDVQNDITFVVNDDGLGNGWTDYIIGYNPNYLLIGAASPGALADELVAGNTNSFNQIVGVIATSSIPADTTLTFTADGSFTGTFNGQGITTVTATTPGETVPLASGDNLVFATAPITIIQSGGANSIISGAGGMTIDATGGSSLIFDGVGGDLVNEGPTSEFVGGPTGAASTIVASAGGSDTIFAASGVLYQGSQGANSLFIGGAAPVTVAAAAVETAFAGTGGGSYTPGGTAFFFFGGGGSDTIDGGAAAPTVWGNSNEKLTLAGTAQGAVVVAFGDNDSIDASGAGGGNVFIAVSEALSTPGGTFSGNTTLAGSSAGGDTFALFSEGNPPPAHTITIDDWQASDALFLGYGAADLAVAAAALAAAAPGAGAAFTLSDQTTVVFVGNHPTVA